jgi:hypothetical protein
VTEKPDFFSGVLAGGLLVLAGAGAGAFSFFRGDGFFRTSDVGVPPDTSAAGAAAPTAPSTSARQAFPFSVKVTGSGLLTR